MSVARGSDNVFEDLGFEHPGDELAKVELVRLIARRITALRLPQRKVGALIGLHQPDVSRLLNGVTTGYSIDKLAEILATLGADVEIRVRPARQGPRGRVTVTSAA